VEKNRRDRLVEREVDLDTMEDNGDGSYSLVCRCGQLVSIHESDMDQGLQLIECAQCNLRFRILYALADPGEP
jgi:DNA-directed RNA polymerase subunit RPC12/RpoP